MRDEFCAMAYRDTASVNYPEGGFPEEASQSFYVFTATGRAIPDRGSKSIIARSMVTTAPRFRYLRSRSSTGRKTNDCILQRVGGGYQLYAPAQWGNVRFKDAYTTTPPDLMRNKGTQTVCAPDAAETTSRQQGEGRRCFQNSSIQVPARAAELLFPQIPSFPAAVTSAPPFRPARRQQHFSASTANTPSASLLASANPCMPGDASSAGAARATMPVFLPYANSPRAAFTSTPWTADAHTTCSTTKHPMPSSLVLTAPYPAPHDDFSSVVYAKNEGMKQRAAAPSVRAAALGQPPHARSCHENCKGLGNNRHTRASCTSSRPAASHVLLTCPAGADSVAQTASVFDAAYGRGRNGTGKKPFPALWRPLSAYPDSH